MEAGDKVKIVGVGHFYEGRTGVIEDYNSRSGEFNIRLDADGRTVWVGSAFLKQIEEDLSKRGEHYQRMPINPLMLAKAMLSKKELKGAMKFQLIKYTLRAGLKDGESVEKDKAKFKDYKKLLKKARKGKRFRL